MRVAIYARVSTDDKGQDVENQLIQLRAWCAQEGHTITNEYHEFASGAKDASKRPKLAALLEDATKAQFDLVLFWALDRLSRQGMAATMSILQKLAVVNVKFRSFTEPHLSTDNELVANVLLACMSSLAKVERTRISDRTKAGMDRAKAEGARFGRPAIPEAKRLEIKNYRGNGLTMREVARLAGVNVATVHKYA